MHIDEQLIKELHIGCFRKLIAVDVSTNNMGLDLLSIPCTPIQIVKLWEMVKLCVEKGRKIATSQI